MVAFPVFCSERLKTRRKKLETHADTELHRRGMLPCELITPKA